MNKQIQDIQKNMTTIFEGYVNGFKFTNRDEMNSYIGKCISEGTPINDISYSNTTRISRDPKPKSERKNGHAIIMDRQNEISWLKYVNELNNLVPDPYDTVLGYIIPFIHENIWIDNSNRNEIISDFKNKLVGRMSFMEDKVFSKIRTWRYDINQVHQWLETMIDGLNRKCEWCKSRLESLDLVLNVANTDSLIGNNTNIDGINAFHEIYSEAHGFCQALCDICKDIQKQNQCGSK